MTFCYVFRTEEVAPHDFLFRRNSVSEKWQGGRATPFPFSPKIRESAPFVPRSRHTPSFFAENPRVGTFVLCGRATRLPFSLTTRMARGQRYCLKRNPMCIFAHKRVATRAQHEKHASKNTSKTRALPPPDDTAPAPPSPSLVRLAYDP